MALTFRPFVEQDFERLKSWFDNPKMGRWLSYPTTEWFDYVLHTPNVYGWMICEGDLPVVYIQMDTEAGKIGYPSIAVNSKKDVLIGYSRFSALKRDHRSPTATANYCRRRFRANAA